VANITDRIALDGGPAVRETFQSILKAGVDAGEGLKAAFKDIGLDKDLTPQFDRARKSAAELGDGFSKAVKSIGGTVQEFGKITAGVTGAISAVVGAVFALTKSASSAAHEIEQAARRTGQTTTEYQKLSFGFKQTGVDAGELTRAFAKISQEATKAAQEGKQSAGAFEKYGIALRGADGHARSITAILFDVADVMARTDSATERAGIAAELFGARVGTKMVGLLSQGSGGIKAMAADAEKLGVVLSEHEIEAGTKFEQAMVRLGGTVEATREKFGLAFAPAFTDAINQLADALGRMQPTIVAVGKAIADTLGPYLKEILISVTAAGAVATLALALGTLLKSIQILAAPFRLLFSLAGLAASLSPVGLAIIAIAAVIGLLALALVKVDWAKWAGTAVDAWNKIVETVSAVVDAITAPFTKFFDWLLGKIQAAVDFFSKLLGLVGAGAAGNAVAGAGVGGAVTAAGGGHVRGPGTSTSDSINARLSDGEYVHRTAAVRHYGVSFMHSINSLQLPRFSLGGLVDEVALRLSPLRLAQGGPVTAPSRARVDLSLDGRRYSMSAPASTAQNLRAHAVNRQTSSTGRKPGWYR
jgi:hypothetical protein